MEAAIGRGRSGLEKDGKRKQNIKGEPEEAAAENEAGGRRKEIADEACMKLSVWKSQDGNHSFVSGGQNKTCTLSSVGRATDS